MDVFIVEQSYYRRVLAVFFDSFKLVAYIDEQSLLRNVLLCYLHRGFDYEVVIALGAAGQLVPIHDA